MLHKDKGNITSEDGDEINIDEKPEEDEAEDIKSGHRRGEEEEEEERIEDKMEREKMAGVSSETRGMREFLCNKCSKDSRLLLVFEK